MSKINSATKHLLRLVQQGSNSDGWAKCSSVVWPLMAEIPTELVELKPDGDAGMVRLTETGITVLEWT